jgi:hypothetical protein
MSFLDIALPLAEKGFRVFPLLPKQKRPYAMAGEYDHFDAASTDEVQLREWDAQVPNANVGVSPDEHFCFLETDDEAALKKACADLPPEVWDTTRVSARENRCYYIFRQTMRTRRAGNMTATREGQENLFEFKQYRMYVTGPGSIHPKTGNPYEVEWGQRVPAMPDVLLDRLCELHGNPKATDRATMLEETKRQTELLDRFLECYKVAATGDWFNKGNQWYRPIECPWREQHENPNEGTSTCIVYTEGGGYGFDCKHRCSSKGWKEFRAEVQRRFPDRQFSFIEPTTDVIMEPTEEARPLFHTKEETLHAPQISFLIEGFLQRDGATAIAGPVGGRKTLIALNVAHALVTGEPLFDRFKVSQKPSRVIYLCPEVSLTPFADRLKRIGLQDYVGTLFLYRTLSAEGTLKLSDPALQAYLPGSVVILDTAIRFLEGDENSSTEMRVFAEEVFSLLRKGADAVVLLHHSPKGSGKDNAITLDNCMRGSGELAAFLTACWGTRLQDPNNPYESASYLVNVKQRDFESVPFEVTSGPDCRLHVVGDGSERVRLASQSNPANRDGKEETALQFMRDNPKLSLRKVVEGLKTLGIKRGITWVRQKRSEIGGTGVRCGPAD